MTFSTSFFSISKLSHYLDSQLLFWASHCFTSLPVFFPEFSFQLHTAESWLSSQLSTETFFFMQLFGISSARSNPPLLWPFSALFVHFPLDILKIRPTLCKKIVGIGEVNRMWFQPLRSLLSKRSVA